MAIYLTNERYEEIKQKVVNLFVQHRVSCVPVNGFELALKMGIRVIPYSAIAQNKRHLLIKKSEDGFCVEKTTGEWLIYYNDEKDYGRINNTIFHEIGHIVLDHTEDSELDEKEVKFVDKDSMVPPVLVHKLNINNPADIANIFEVSFEAACYAYSYYKKWLKYGNFYYTDYELTLLNMFQDIA